MGHPRIDQFGALRIPGRGAAALGYRLPAEWEPQSCVWLSPPHNPETWPGCLDAAREQFAAFVEVLRHHAPISTTEGLGIETDDSWVRDFGPLFVVCRPCSSGETPIACHDFHFNCWGQRYERRDRDDVVPQHIAHRLGIPIWVHDLVFEGGAIDVNGRGTLMMTEQCLLNRNRNPSLDRGQLERRLHDAMGTTHAVWLPGGIAGDDTDGHIDTVARFISPDTVAAVAAPPGHVDHDITRRNLATLRASRQPDGGSMNVVELPAPEPLFYDYPPDRFDDGGRSMLPASYANFLISNGGVFVPTFGQPADDTALRILELAMPRYAIEPVRCEHLVVGRGGLHCLSLPQPGRSFASR